MVGNKNKIEVSIQPNADLVVGQYVSFVATLSSDKSILQLKNVIIKNASNNIKFDKETISLIYEQGSRIASAQLGFTVLTEVSGSPVKDGSPFTFEVHTDVADFNPVPFKGTVNEIDLNSLALFIEKPYLKTVVTGDDKPSEKDNFTAIHTTLKSISGKILVGTPIFVTSSVHHKMNDFQFKDANNKQEILPEKIGPNEGISISSDQHGLVKFYLYPKVSEVTSLVLQLVILNDVADIRAKKILYVANYINPGYMDSIGTPDIAGFSMGDLFANQGLAYFLTTVSSYDNVAIGDVVLFFVNGNYTGYSVTIEDEKKQLDQPSIRLPYTIFERDVLSEFSYTVIKEGGDALYSLPLPLNYVGGVPYEPDPDAKREYEPCIVHTSLGVDSEHIIPSGYGNYVNYAAIMKYPGYKYNGLFVEIVRSNTHDPKEKIIPVPLNITDITLNMYINSQNRNFVKHYTQQINLTEIGDPGNKDSIYFHIPYEDIVDVTEVGDITFDYQFYQDIDFKYGISWSANIQTTPSPGNH
ncbi:hypothetical protein [Xenorhabdus kozodoii]|uniref:Uncharacterized protein n=1 Tax=Xenorhabdus kozodoii TaxID=351676 RepID=A0A2D0LI53_9GAMM|nr:hypothetical protein [Xenorhabdus kozodoii]PHM75260.1 hypothetical protein Xkoz_00276 [Xenorhabdus kozodoii]